MITTSLISIFCDLSVKRYVLHFPIFNVLLHRTPCVVQTPKASSLTPFSSSENHSKWRTNVGESGETLVPRLKQKVIQVTHTVETKIRSRPRRRKNIKPDTVYNSSCFFLSAHCESDKRNLPVYSYHRYFLAFLCCC